MIEDLARTLRQHADRHPGQTVIPAPVAGVMLLRSDHPKPPAHRVMRPSLCLVAQGAKWASFGDDRLSYRAGEALVVGVATPSVGRVVEAHPGAPCLVLVLELDLGVLREVAEGLAGMSEAPHTARPADRRDASSGGSRLRTGDRGVFVTSVEGPLGDCALRLARLLDQPGAFIALYPLILREICFWLLTGPNGADVQKICLSDTPSERVIEALNSLRQRFAEPVRMSELAALARMSVSAFHRRFKALTSQSPLQYQKQLRLLEARRLMVVDALGVEPAALRVGYESASQFSREYARLFGAPPRRDAMRLRSAYAEALPDLETPIAA
ncbi:MAG: AraC family transcriptional regulator [Alphaproteobacteria bacterium]|nr:AraC family transcriptional regulator [Alphaproteobacteria bacterium]